MLDQCPRMLTEVMQKRNMRLGKHFQCQGAQRIAMGRLEELADQSHAPVWVMLIDKVDQNCAFCPQVCDRDPWIDLGGHPIYEAPLEDNVPRRAHGERDATCHVFLLILWETSLKEDGMCEELIINSDNTERRRPTSTL